MCQVCDFLLAESALTGFELEVLLLEQFEDGSEPQELFIHSSGKHDDIVEINQTIGEVRLTQGVLHELLVT